MEWTIMTGTEESFIRAPQWAKRLIHRNGRFLWWDRMRKFKPVNGNEFLLTDRFEDDYQLIAERRLIPDVSVKY
ncbi:TPA: hypothetical protein PXM28_001918 [Yersinia enterocolitica]|nr:hypothetical protein [Yersinia enterocolitica]